MVWTVRGDGSDIFGVADSFRYVYQRFQGDGSIIARIQSISRTDPWAKGGVMIRESLDPGSRFAAVFATPGPGVWFQARADTAGLTAADTLAATAEQKALEAPVWIKLERKGNQFHAYYAIDRAPIVWTPMVWKPQPISMSQTVYVGLAVTSHAAEIVCEARFSNVVIDNPEGELAGVEVAANLKQAVERAYEDLQRFGKWRDDPETKKKYGNLIASSLFAIAKAKELRGEPAGVVLADYYRIAELLPDSPFTINALIYIATLDGEKGLEYAVKHLAHRSREDQDRFYIALMKGYSQVPGRRERETAVELFMRHVDSTSNPKLLEKAIAAIESSEHAVSMCKSLIQHSMARPSSERTAVTGLRYMALNSAWGQEDDRILELARWATTQFKDTPLAACAMAVMADRHYEQGRYAEAVEVFRPRLLSKNRTESQTVAGIESALTSYRTNTLLHGLIDLEQIYAALGRKADGLGLAVTALHCHRKVAEARGLSLDDFKRSALKGVKHCDSRPENEVWFWKGLIAADEGDLGAATAAYERFLQGDDKSVLAARAYYDIARTKMAIGEDAKEWIAKAKALSPCDAAIQLERRLNTRISPQRSR
jgi:tetratricopeptide (TPR) repeat protein